MIDKLELTKRLQREGRWEEAEGFKNRVIKECRAAGLKRDEASDHAWAELERNYPPLPAPEPDPPELAAELPASEPREATGETFAAGPEPRAARGRIVGLDQVPESWGELPASTALRTELQWANSNRLWVVRETSSGGFQVDLAKACEPAPSRSAISWLQLAITNPAKFMDLVAKKLGDEEHSDEEKERQAQMQLEEVHEILQEMYEQYERELVADVPGVVREKVRGLVSDWCERFALTLPDEAPASLEAHVSRLVQDCIRAVGRASEGVLGVGEKV